MKSEQQLKADARKSAQSAPQADPKIGEAAKVEAEGAMTDKSRVQRIYNAPNKTGGNKKRRDLDDQVSEFDDPAANTVEKWD